MCLNFSILKSQNKNIKFHMHDLRTNFNKILEVLKSIIFKFYRLLISLFHYNLCPL